MGVHREDEAPLLQIGLTAECLRLLPNTLQRRYQDGHEQGDDGDDHQELDQGEASLSGHGEIPSCDSSVCRI
jgi:hypothetical protein